MLKIKDDVDLKELEKFGLKPRYDEYTGEIIAFYSQSKYDFKNAVERILRFNKKENKFLIFHKGNNFMLDDYAFIKSSFGRNNSCDFDLLYDLIKVGLVGKVENK